jgi:hypothetical protein
MAVMVQSSGNFQKLVGLYENPILEYWQDKYAKAYKDSMIPFLFDEVQSDNPTEAISEMVGAIDFKEWNGEFTYSDVKEGNTKVFTPIIWQAGMKYDRFLLSNAKLINLKTEHGLFALGAARTRNECAGGIFTYADQTAGYVVNGTTVTCNLVANGLPIASNSHTSANYSSTQDNLEALELNEENLETVCQKLYDAKDENGKFAGMQASCLIVPTALRKKALEVVGSTGKSDTGDNNANVYDGNIKVCVWSDFRKQSGKTGQPWCVCDLEAARESLKVVNRLESGDQYELISWKDEATQTWTIGSVMWFTMGAFSHLPFQFSIPA